MWKKTVGPLLAWIALIGPGTSSSYSKAVGVPAAWKALYRAVHTKPPVLKTASGRVRTADYSGSRLSVAAMSAMRSQNPRLFDRLFPAVGRVVAADTQIRIAMAQGVTPTNGLLPNTPLYNYLEFRRSLEPGRFDYYHPVLGPILAENQRLQTQTNPTPLPGGILPPPIGDEGGGESPGGGGGQPGGGGGDHGGGGGGGTPDPTGPGGVVPPPPDTPPPASVPEPGSVLLVLAGAGVLGLGHLRSLRRRKARAGG